MDETYILSLKTINSDLYARDNIGCFEKLPDKVNTGIPVSESIGKFDRAMMIIACYHFFIKMASYKGLTTVLLK